MTAIEVDDDVADLLSVIASAEGYGDVQNLLRDIGESYRDQQIEGLALGR